MNLSRGVISESDMRIFLLLLLNALLVAVHVGAFTATISKQCNHCHCCASTSNLAMYSTKTDEWTSLTEDGGVKMKVISPSPSTDDDTKPISGKDDVTVEYVGSIATRNWSTDEVISCWLPDQNLDDMEFTKILFQEFAINGTKLCNEQKFNAKFVKEGLGILKASKIHNILENVSELTKYDKSHPPGTVFDKNTFTFRLGKGMVINALDISIAEMKVGQTVTLVARSDYAYGAKGVKTMGNVIVPPYATVSFDLTLVEIK